jgi:hypothetical protein
LATLSPAKKGKNPAPTFVAMVRICYFCSKSSQPKKMRLLLFATKVAKNNIKIIYFISIWSIIANVVNIQLQKGSIMKNIY